MKKVFIAVLVLAMVLSLGWLVYAQQDQGGAHDCCAGQGTGNGHTAHGGSKGMPHDMSHGGMNHSMMMNRPVQSVTVDGLKLSLDIMEMDMHMSMQKMKGNPVPAEFAKGADRAIMFYVMDESSRLIIDDADVTYTIESSKGKEETGTAKWYGDHYGAPFKGEKGDYKLKFTVNADGNKHSGEFVYALR